VRIAALRDPAIKLILPELGHFKNATDEKATLEAALKRRSGRGDRGKLGAAGVA
jgi:hypothetical protein